MGQLRLAKQMDLEAFPGCLSVVDNTPPEAQCQEAQIDESAGTMVDGLATITEATKFVGIDLAGKKVTVTLPAPEAGTFNVLSNTDDVLVTDNTFGTDSGVVAYTVHDDGQVYLTRSEASFIRFVENLGNAHSTVNGQLYTDVATGPLANACSDTYAPQ